MRIVREHWLTLLGGVVAVAGSVLLAWARTSQFGWTAYAPLDNNVSVPKALVFDQRQAVVALLLLLVGVAFMGVGLGASMARRRSEGRP